MGLRELGDRTSGQRGQGPGGRVVAVGTTSLRLLESAAREDGTLAPFSGDTAIFITPGYRFKAVDVLMTNFHLPRSTLFMLVSAFAGMERMRKRLCNTPSNADTASTPTETAACCSGTMFGRAQGSGLTI